MTIQEKMKNVLLKSGIPAKEVRVYGSQIVVTAWSRDAAEKWASLISNFAKVKCMKESIDYAKENKGTCLVPSVVNVWRVWGTI